MRTATKNEKGRCIAKRRPMDVKGLRFNKGQHLDRQRLRSTQGAKFVEGQYIAPQEVGECRHQVGRVGILPCEPPRPLAQVVSCSLINR